MPPGSEEECSQFRRGQAAALGRDPSRIAVSVRAVLEISDRPEAGPSEGRFALRGTPEEIVHHIHAYAQEGVGTIVLDMQTGDIKKVQAMLERFAQEVMPAVAR